NANQRIAAFVKRPASAPLFLFPPEPNQPEINLTSRAVRRWHGRIADLASELKELTAFGQQTIFVLPALGVADRITKTLQEYGVTGLTMADGGWRMADSTSDNSSNEKSVLEGE